MELVFLREVTYFGPVAEFMGRHAEQTDAASRWAQQPQEQLKKRALPRTVRAYDARKVALRQRKIYSAIFCISI